MANGLKRKRSGQFDPSSNNKNARHTPVKPLPNDFHQEQYSNDNGNGDNDVTLTINEEYAKRFEHNKKREELHRLQEKYTSSASARDEPVASLRSSSDDSSESEEEDDEGIYASVSVDAQIQQTLDAIRNKDPRVYDSQINFFSTQDVNESRTAGLQQKTSRPVFLSEYHRNNLLRKDGDASETSLSNTFNDHQMHLKNSIIRDIHDVVSQEVKDNDDSGEDALLVTKEPQHKSEKHEDTVAALAETDIQAAENDPEGFLSKYLTTRAWVPTDAKQFEPFDSDDEEHDQAAEDFEEAYNMRFEDPNRVNEKLMSHARDVVAQHSVRKTTLTSRQRARETIHNEKAAARQLRKEEKARLRKLKVDAVQHKLQQIKETAGIPDEQMQDEDWHAFLNAGWDDQDWDSQMQKRFGNQYYKGGERSASSGGQQGKGKLKKPKWKEDIDINDIVPAFEAGAQSVSVIDASEGPDEEPEEDAKRRLQQQSRQSRDVRIERQRIEQLVDEQLNVENVKADLGKKHQGTFRYRETSPVTFGLTAKDILMASDSQLNQHAGLKKYAAFRDADKKRRDRKTLAKNARLKKWRKDTFGDDEGSKESFAERFDSREDTGPHRETQVNESVVGDAQQGKSKRRRRRSKP